MHLWTPCTQVFLWIDMFAVNQHDFTDDLHNLKKAIASTEAGTLVVLGRLVTGGLGDCSSGHFALWSHLLVGTWHASLSKVAGSHSLSHRDSGTTSADKTSTDSTGIDRVGTRP